MSILSLPVAADTLARVFAGAVNPAPKAAVPFAEIPGRSSQATIPTRYGPVAATLYHPPSDVGCPPVYVNVHGGGFVVGHPEQDDPWCRYLAANAGVVVVNPDYVLAPRHRFPTAPQQIYDIVCWAAERTGTGTAPGCAWAARARAATSAPRPLDWRWRTAHRSSRCRCCTTRRSSWPLLPATSRRPSARGRC